jgi:hypothetical protein
VSGVASDSGENETKAVERREMDVCGDGGAAMRCALLLVFLGVGVSGEQLDWARVETLF